ncbi:tetratricopeptide (TPR) repeat protein [Catalinimonas alkaloidigena]|uniref:tetratricopeptide repeat protein n=1 Tax=Catalinimonas alkaloidigena TaxID=1075417 RepID=UPI002404C770|nr:tetratricopeptide repeat protein [Catalinimonas alkaloidigena]MDF9799859.1 tetratricopeptide (TPR) repeat protein [Catalinimonas alkaloidigena]
MANRVKGNKQKSAKGSEKHDNTELLESSDALRETLVDKTGTFFKNKRNQNVALGIGVAIALVIAGVFGYTYYMESQNTAAQDEMFQAVFYFEADSLNRALNGDGNNYGFLEIIDEYGGTEAANLAHYYAGIAYLRQGEYNDAIDHLSDFSASDMLVQARAYALLGDAYMELENYEEAVSHYNKAADYKPNRFFTPQYLVKAALAYEAMGNYAQAIENYDRIIEEFPEATEYQQALKQQTRLQGLASEQ